MILVKQCWHLKQSRSMEKVSEIFTNICTSTLFWQWCCFHSVAWLWIILYVSLYDGIILFAYIDAVRYCDVLCLFTIVCWWWFSFSLFCDVVIVAIVTGVFLPVSFIVNSVWLCFVKVVQCYYYADFNDWNNYTAAIEISFGKTTTEAQLVECPLRMRVVVFEPWLGMSMTWSSLAKHSAFIITVHKDESATVRKSSLFDFIPFLKKSLPVGFGTVSPNELYLTFVKMWTDSISYENNRH